MGLVGFQFKFNRYLKKYDKIVTNVYTKKKNVNQFVPVVINTIDNDSNK